MLGQRLMRGPVGAQQSRIDAIVAAARANGESTIAKPDFKRYAPPPLEPTNDLLSRRIEEELHYVRRLLVASGDALADDPLVLKRFTGALQSFDVIAQVLGHLASVVGSLDRDAAIERIGMAELRARLERPAAGLKDDFRATLVRHDRNPFGESADDLT